MAYNSSDLIMRRIVACVALLVDININWIVTLIIFEVMAWWPDSRSINRFLILKCLDRYIRASQCKAITQPYQIQMGLAAFKFLLLFRNEEEKQWIILNRNQTSWCGIVWYTCPINFYSNNGIGKWWKYDWCHMKLPNSDDFKSSASKYTSSYWSILTLWFMVLEVA